MKLPQLIILCVSLPFSTVAVAGKTRELSLGIHVDSFHLLRVAQDRVEAEIDLSVITDLDGHLDHIDFSNIHANSVPFFAQPLDKPLEVHRGESLRLPPITVTVYTGNLDSLDPVIAILDNRQTRLQADFAIRIQATTFERLLLRDAHPLAVLSIDQEVDVQPPGGLLGRASAIALLRAAQIAMAGAAHLPIRLSSGDPVWRTEMGIAQTALLHARACHAFAGKNANNVCIDRLAFATGPQDAVSTAELGEPWRFDPQLARSYADLGGRVQSGDPQITVQSLAGSTASPATLQPVGTASERKVILLPSRSRLSLLDPQSPGLYSRLHVSTLGVGLAFRIQPGQPDCDQLAVFRLTRTSDGDWLPRAVYLSGSLSGQTVTFSRPVDRSAMGSPILTPQGVIGVVQSETTGTLLSAAY